MTDPPAEPTTTGIDARLASVLCYAGWWVTGLVFLFVERDHKGVRFHAAQSLVVFGGLSAVMLAIAALNAAALFLVPSLFRGMWALNSAVWLAGVLLWLVLMVLTFRGDSWRVPFAGDLADRLARGGG